MPQVVEEIPVELGAEVAAALAWLNSRSDAAGEGDGAEAFRVTGIVDPQDALASRTPGGPVDLSLVLCRGDLCVRERVRVEPRGDGFACSAIDAGPAASDPPAHLDPPAGVRARWLDEQLAKHAFAMLVFYRGFW